MDTRDGRILSEAQMRMIEEIDAPYVKQMGYHPTPTQRAENKVGRNDPCPCGSGLKFKRCCLFGGKQGKGQLS